MGRLTKVMSCPDGAKIYDVSNELFKANCSRADKTRMILEKLAYYEELEEQSRLIKLPCKIGDKLYYTDLYYNAVVPVRLNEVIIQFVGINTYSYQYNCCSFDECGDVCEEFEFDNNDIGKTVFLTKAEAEVAMNKLRGIDIDDIERD